SGGLFSLRESLIKSLGSSVRPEPALSEAEGYPVVQGLRWCLIGVSLEPMAVLYAQFTLGPRFFARALRTFVRNFAPVSNPENLPTSRSSSVIRSHLASMILYSSLRFARNASYAAP